MGISATFPNVQPSAACTRGASNTELNASALNCASKTAVRIGHPMTGFCAARQLQVKPFEFGHSRI
jgi:hypothetical protein